jgi:ribosome-associated protein
MPAVANREGEDARPERDLAGVMKLDQFLKWSGITATGGQAKVLIQGGQVRVNGVVETRRGRMLRRGDRVEVEGRIYPVERS